MKIDLQYVLEILREYSYLKNKLEYIPSIKPNHGPCCTCQECGYNHDDCVCLHNEIVEKLMTAIDRQIY